MVGMSVRYLIVIFIAAIATATPVSAQTQMPDVSLTADQTTISPGQCTNIFLRIRGNWTYVLSQSLNYSYMNTYKSTSYDVSTRVCPTSTTTYLVLVDYMGQQTRPTVTINVSASPAQVQPQQPYNNTNSGNSGGPSGYTYCADENQYCRFSDTEDVAYGANGSFYYHSAVTGGIDCDNGTFGDPAYGTAKACYTRQSSSSNNNSNSGNLLATCSLNPWLYYFYKDPTNHAQLLDPWSSSTTLGVVNEALGVVGIALQIHDGIIDPISDTATAEIWDSNGYTSGYFLRIVTVSNGQRTEGAFIGMSADQYNQFQSYPCTWYD